MTDRPSIESLREIVYGMKEPSTTAEIEALDAALSELESLRAENEALKAERDELRSCLQEANANRIRMIGALNAERARADALAARVEFLVSQSLKLDSMGYDAAVLAQHLIWIRDGGVDGTPQEIAADALREYPDSEEWLNAHDARVRREALEGAWERVSEWQWLRWNEGPPVVDEEALQLAILGPESQPNEQETK